MVLTASATANFLGAVSGNHVMISKDLPPDLTAPTTVRFLTEPVTGSISLVQNERRTHAKLSSVEIVQGIATAMDNVARAGGGHLTLMHADTILSQQKIPSAAAVAPKYSPVCPWVVAGIVLLLAWLVWRSVRKTDVIRR